MHSQALCLPNAITSVCSSVSDHEGWQGSHHRSYASIYQYGDSGSFWRKTRERARVYSCRTRVYSGHKTVVRTRFLTAVGWRAAPVVGAERSKNFKLKHHEHGNAL